MEKNKNYFFKSTVVLLIILWGFLSLVSQYIGLPTSVNAQTQKVASVSGAALQTASFSASIQSFIKSASNSFTLRVPVLMYHYIRNGVPLTDELSYRLSVSPNVLEEQLKYLADNGYISLSLTDVFESLQNQTPLPPKSVVLTFDDGYRDFYTTAFPLLKKYNLRAVSFYVVGYSNYPGYMNWDMVKEIHKSGLVDVESHTLSHLPLSKLAPEQKQKEIFESKKVLEETLGKKINYFAYPYGDFDESVIELVQQAGYRLAFSTRSGSSLLPAESYFLKRVPVNGEDSFETFKYKLDKY